LAGSQALVCHRRLSAALVVAIISSALFVSPPVEASASAEALLLSDLARTRASHGLRPLPMAPDLRDAARAHASTMARRGETFGGSAAAARASGWVRMGVNVGRGGMWQDIATLWHTAATSRATMLDRRADDVGIGVVEGPDGLLYAVQLVRTRGSWSGTRAARSHTARAAATARASTEGALVVSMLVRMTAAG
jgi:hypothetical protein